MCLTNDVLYLAQAAITAHLTRRFGCFPFGANPCASVLLAPGGVRLGVLGKFKAAAGTQGGSAG